LQELSILRFPFDTAQLPLNGIYFFYEDGDMWGHLGQQPRIEPTDLEFKPCRCAAGMTGKLTASRTSATS
jgi:hypothetical protein